MIEGGLSFSSIFQSLTHQKDVENFMKISNRSRSVILRVVYRIKIGEATLYASHVIDFKFTEEIPDF